MFQFTRTTIINENKDYTTGKTLFSAEAGKSLSVKRGQKFLTSNITKAYKKAASAAVMSKATFDLTKIPVATEGIYRLAFYIRLNGSNNSYYSNDMVFRGKPLYVEFEHAANENIDSTFATKVVNLAKKYITQSSEFKILNISANGTSIVVEGVDEYQIFTKADLEWLNPDAGQFAWGGYLGKYEVLASAAVVNGKAGFGTYEYMMKNMQLPTAANTRWNRINMDETPAIGATYDQYTIYYKKDRGILGSDAVGDSVTSTTCHVFFVNKNISADFEAALAGTNGAIPAANWKASTNTNAYDMYYEAAGPLTKADADALYEPKA